MRRLAFFLMVASCHREPPPSARRELATVIEASAPVASLSASVAIEAPPAPAGCRRTTAPGTDLAHVSDADLRGLILGGSLGAKEALDCRGHSVTFTTPMSPHVDRLVIDPTHMAVFVSVAREPGYTDHCPGFAAIVRAVRGEIVTEGVGPEMIDDCGPTGLDLRVAMLDGHLALLFPHVVSNGEDGDAETAWSVSISDEHGALRPVGEITHTRSMGNGSTMSGKWLDSLDAKLLDAGSLQIEEHWELVREDPDAGEVHGRKKTVVHTYALDGGMLVRQ